MKSNTLHLRTQDEIVSFFKILAEESVKSAKNRKFTDLALQVVGIIYWEALTQSLYMWLKKVFAMPFN